MDHQVQKGSRVICQQLRKISHDERKHTFKESFQNLAKIVESVRDFKIVVLQIDKKVGRAPFGDVFDHLIEVEVEIAHLLLFIEHATTREPVILQLSNGKEH